MLVRNCDLFIQVTDQFDNMIEDNGNFKKPPLSVYLRITVILLQSNRATLCVIPKNLKIPILYLLQSS